MTKIKFINTCILLFMLALSLSARTIKVGIYSDKPIIYRDSDGSTKGFYADIINKIAESEDWDINFIDGSWSDSLNKLKDGKIDLLTSITIVEERQPLMDFNKESLYTMWGELYSSSRVKFENVSDFEGKQIGLLRKGANAIYFKKLMKDFEISFIPVEYDNFVDIFQDVKTRKIDGGVSNNIFGYTHLDEYELSKPILMFNPYKMYFAAPKNKNGELLDTIDKYIKNWKQDNDSYLYSRLEYWFGYHKHELVDDYKSLRIYWLITILLLLIIFIYFYNYKKFRSKQLSLDLKKNYHEVKERYRNLLNISSDGVLLMDNNENIFEVNPAMSELFGYEPKEFLNLGLQDLFENDKSNSLEDLRMAMGRNESFFRGISGISKEEVILPTEISGTPLEVNGKRYYFLTIHSIDDRLKMQDELRLSETRMQKVFESDMMGIVVWDKDGKILDSNDKFLDIIGYGREEFETGVSWSDLTPPEFIDFDIKVFEEIVANGSCKPYEKEFIRKDGSRVNIILGGGMLDNESKQTIAFIIDVSDKKLIEQELAEKQQEVKQLYNMATPICLFSTDYKILEVNDSFCKTFGLDSKDILSKKYNSIWNKEQCEQKDQVLKKLKQDKEVVEYEISKTINDELRIFNVASKPYYGLSGELVGIVENYFDITEWKETELKLKQYHGNLSNTVSARTSELETKQESLQQSQQALTFLLEDVNDARKELSNMNTKLEQANEDLESFAYSVSHDLRAPLRHISGFSQLLMNNYNTELNEKADHYLKTIVKSTGMMGTLIDDLLVFSRMGRTRMQKFNINLNTLVADIIDDMSPDYDADKLEWDVKELVDVYGDPTLIRQVLINLIANSIKFSKHRELAKIQIGCALQKEDIVFYVKDNGVGFDMRYVDKLFGVFQRLHRQEDFEGTGIGLANVKRIITRHGGKVWAEGVPEEGASFYFTIPRND